jgi:hypothetical protein
MTQDISWALTEQIEVTQLTELLKESSYSVIRIADRNDWFILTARAEAEQGRSLLINDEFRDLGDDFIEYISLIDDYHEQGGGELGKSLLMRPWQDDNN